MAAEERLQLRVSPSFFSVLSFDEWLWIVYDDNMVDVGSELVQVRFIWHFEM